MNMIKHIFKKLLIYTLAAAMCLTTTGCGSSDSDTPEVTDTPSPKTITRNELSLTLPGDYYTHKKDEYTFYYTNSNSICIGNRETFDDLTSSGINVDNIDEYVKIIMEKSNITATAEPAEGNDNARIFSWNNTFNNKEFTYLAYVCKTDSSYWLIQFACLADSYEELKDIFFNSLSTIKIEGTEAK